MRHPLLAGPNYGGHEGLHWATAGPRGLQDAALQRACEHFTVHSLTLCNLFALSNPPSSLPLPFLFPLSTLFQGSDGSSSTSDLHSHPSGVLEGENGIGLTAEEEQTADQLLADIQSAVDEMLQDFHTNTLDMEEAPPSPHTVPAAPSEKVGHCLAELISHT